MLTQFSAKLIPDTSSPCTARPIWEPKLRTPGMERRALCVGTVVDRHDDAAPVSREGTAVVDHLVAYAESLRVPKLRVPKLRVKDGNS